MLDAALFFRYGLTVDLPLTKNGMLFKNIDYGKYYM
jgi:hypothetical protein